MQTLRRCCATVALGVTLGLGLMLSGVQFASPAGAAAPAGVDPAGVRPVPGAVVRPFAAPEHPYGPGHRGVDLAARPGTPVRAARAGVVTWAGPVAGVGYVTVDHGGGLSTTYADVEPAVDAGTWVAASQRIGVLAAAAVHLDWGARWDGGARRTYIDPLRLLEDLRPVLVRPDADV